MLRAIVPRAVRAMSDASQALSLRRAIAFQVGRDDHPWDVSSPGEPLTEKLLGGVRVPPTLRRDVAHGAMLLHGPPRLVLDPVDRPEDFIQVPCVPWSRASATELI